MNEQTPKRFFIRSEWIGMVEVVNAVLLFALGYVTSVKEFWPPFLVGAAYAAGKNFTERCLPKNEYKAPKTNEDDTATESN